MVIGSKSWNKSAEKSANIASPGIQNNGNPPTASLMNVSRSENEFLVEEERQDREGLVNLGDWQPKLK